MPKSSFKASDLKKGGGLYEGPIKVTNSRFEKFGFNGKAEPATSLIFDGEHLDEAGDLTSDQFVFPLGKGWEASDDGEVPTDNKSANFYCHEKETSPSARSNFGILVQALDALGYEIDGERGAEDLNDRVFIVKRDAMKGKGDKERQYYTVTGILPNAPWEKASTAKRVAALPKDNKSTDRAENGGLDDETLLSIAVTVVKGAGSKGLKPQDLPQAIQRAIASWPNPAEKKILLTQRAEIVEKLSIEYFTSNSDVITYNTETQYLTMA